MFLGTLGLQYTSEMVSTTIGYIGSVFSDMSGLLLLIVGVGLGLIVIGAIISVIRK
jgi:hypothetical protein